MQRNWEDFAQAIILQAVQDYRRALKVLRRKPESKVAQALEVEVRSFFQSWWFAQLTDIGSKFLIEKLREEAE